MKSLSVNGTELWYVERGAGTPVVLVHGFPLDHTMWAGQTDGVLAERCRVIAPDLRGFGRSPVQGDKVTMEQFADDLASLLDAMGISEPVVLCGLSMGGYITFQFWRKYAARLQGLILCDTRAGADSPEVAAGRLAMADRLQHEPPTLLAETMTQKLFAESTYTRHPEVVEGVRRVMTSTNPHGIAAAARGMAERPDMTASLGQIDCPTLVLVGEQDVVSPPGMMQEMAEAIRGSAFVTISAAGHMAPLENPAEVNAAISAFLADED